MVPGLFGCIIPTERSPDMDRMQAWKTRLAWLETRLQGIIETSATRWLAPSSPARQLTLGLVACMQQGVKEDAYGYLIAPNQFILWVHPVRLDEYQIDPLLAQELCTTLQTAGQDAGFVFLAAPTIDVLADPDLAPGETRLSAGIQGEQMAQTSALESEAQPALANSAMSAFLIVDGTRIYSLSGGAVNIGRRADNDLVIDDGRVSRQHAQLRLVHDHYMIFDLESTGGTFVNNQQVSQCLLYPGDVISLAGVPLVFGQELAGDTQKLPV